MAATREVRRVVPFAHENGRVLLRCKNKGSLRTEGCVLVVADAWVAHVAPVSHDRVSHKIFRLIVGPAGKTGCNQVVFSVVFDQAGRLAGVRGVDAKEFVCRGEVVF